VLLHEERDLIVIDKPAGLLTMPSAPGRADHEDSVLSRARLYARHKRGRQAYVGLLHRLDRGTSGALAVALDRQVHAAGRAKFKVHAFDRTYLALVRGVPSPAVGTIDEPISATYRDGRRDAGGDDSETLEARTHYRVVESFGREAALVELTLDTGRQHQIRIHLASIGHPVLGDQVYGAARGSAKPTDRPLLHAWRLGFPHPLHGGRIAVEAPIPRDFTARLLRLRRASLGEGLERRDSTDAPPRHEGSHQRRSQQQHDRRREAQRVRRGDSK
jgi:23S rRNA pseudouridine1911/1915/1917 synthase